MFKRGDILKLSEVGLDHLYKLNPERKELVRKYRFKFKCTTRNYPKCISVVKIGGSSGYQSYHQEFIEKDNNDIQHSG